MDTTVIEGKFTLTTVKQHSGKHTSFRNMRLLYSESSLLIIKQPSVVKRKKQAM